MTDLEPRTVYNRLHYMDKRTLERFKKLLQARRDELGRSVVQAQEAGKTPAQAYGVDEGDRASRSHDKELFFHQTMKSRGSIRAIDAALARIADGTFGECLHCNQEINLKRLEALPWARYCITCQELLEENG